MDRDIKGHKAIFVTPAITFPEYVTDGEYLVTDVAYKLFAKFLLWPLEYGFTDIRPDQELSDYLMENLITSRDKDLHCWLCGEIGRLVEKMIYSPEASGMMGLIGHIDEVLYSHDRTLNHIRWCITTR